MSSDDATLNNLNNEKVRLENKIEAIKKDLRRGLDASKSDQAIELENYEVLMELLRISEIELNEIEVKIHKIENTHY